METKDQTKENTELVSEEGKNIKAVLCQRCGSKVLCPGMAVYAEKEVGGWHEMQFSIAKVAVRECRLFWRNKLRVFLPQLFLPSMRKKSGSFGTEGSVDGDTLKSFWLVDNMFDFENVGFTNDVGRIKYLICADCEIGPIGWHCLDDKQSYYIALERVTHE